MTVSSKAKPSLEEGERVVYNCAYVVDCSTWQSMSWDFRDFQMYF